MFRDYLKNPVPRGDSLVRLTVIENMLALNVHHLVRFQAAPLW